MNRAVIIGNLTRDPELRTTPQGISVTTFTVAVPRGFGDKKETDFIPVVTWRGLADNCAKFLAKGRKVGVSGRIQTRSYDGNNGERRYVTEIVADDVEFLSPKGESTQRTDSPHDGFEPTDDDMSGIFGDEPDDFEPLDQQQMPF